MDHQKILIMTQEGIKQEIKTKVHLKQLMTLNKDHLQEVDSKIETPHYLIHTDQTQ